MTDIFQSARLTLNRAHHHIADLNLQVSVFKEGNGRIYVVEKNPDGTQDVHKIRFVEKIPEDLSCIVFDAANNLRAVLDQIAFAAATAAGSIAPKNAYFPFADNAAELENSIKGRCKDIRPEIVTIFRHFRPYKGGNDALWVLNKLCNAKKHCSLAPLSIADPKTVFWGSIPNNGFFTHGHASTSDGVQTRWDPLEREMTLFEVPVGTKVEIRGHVTFDLSIEGTEILGSQPGVRVLRTMAGEVERVLIAAEEECRRLGFKLS